MGFIQVMSKILDLISFLSKVYIDKKRDIFFSKPLQSWIMLSFSYFVKIPLSAPTP